MTIFFAVTASLFGPTKATSRGIGSKAKGTGLGLAVVKKIADEHGAKIELSNVLEDGEIKGAQVSLSFALETTLGKQNSPAY